MVSRRTPPNSSSRRLPLHVNVVRRLRERGVVLTRDASESASEFEQRLETALMSLFRDEPLEEHFQALYDYTRADLCLWIVTLLGSRRTPDPLEILQDTFVNIYRYAKSFREDGAKSFRVWSRTIAGNLIRRVRNAPSSCSLNSLPEGLEEPIDARRGPIEELCGVEERRSMLCAWLIVLLQYAQAYEALSLRDRQALDLIEVQGLSYAEAGERLKVGLSNMKMIMFRSRKRIRSLIAARLSEVAPLSVGISAVG
jgi:RNA polymerase sigma factor (sigma-70 family)